MRKVAAPHHHVDTHRIAVLHAELITHDAYFAIALEVFTGQHAELHLAPVAVAPVAIIEFLFEKRHPTGAHFAANNGKFRKAFEDTIENELGKERGHSAHGGGVENQLLRPALLGRDLAGLVLGRSQAHVDMDRKTDLLGHRPELVIHIREQEISTGPGRQAHAHRVVLPGPAQFGHGVVDARGGHLPDRTEAGAIEARKIPDEIVVALHSCKGKLLVLQEHEIDHRALRREEDRGGNAVLVHQLQPALGLGDPGMHVVVANARPLQGLGCLVHRCHQTQGFRVRAELPGIATVLVLDELGGLVVEALGQVFLPEIRRLDDVLIAVDDFVVHGFLPKTNAGLRSDLVL